MQEKKNPQKFKKYIYIYICVCVWGGGGGERERERIKHRMGEGIKKKAK